jgi:cytochrome oxidase Cu insertion factor (SCO1/SenC/PrrC family)
MGIVSLVVRPATMAVLAVTLATGCGGSDRDGLHGHVPHDLAPAGAISVPEVFVGRPEAPFVLHAGPGQLLIVYFGYASCPDVCPTTMADLRTALGRLGDDAKKIQLAFITVDPVRDTAAVLAPYVGSFVPGAHALRPPDQATLAAAERAFGARSSIERDLQGRIEVSHTPLCYVVDEAGRVLVEWDFGTKAGWMADDLRILLRAREVHPS